MSRPDLHIPFIDEKNSPSKPGITTKNKSVPLNKKPTEKRKESVKSTKYQATSRISASSTDESRDSKLTSRNTTKLNQSSIDPSNSKSPTKSLPSKSAAQVRACSTPGRVSRTSKIQRPGSSTGGPDSSNSYNRSKQSPANSAKESVYFSR